jgi:hypothetical protein
MKWSTAGAESLIRKVLVPLGGLAVFVLETRQQDPRWLLVSAAVTLMIGQPVASLLDSRKERSSGSERNGDRSL